MASSREIILQGLFIVLVAMIWARARAQSDCTNVLISMAPCLNYVTGSSQTPSSQCCSQLAHVVQSQPRCLCMALNGGGASLGVTINRTLALALPALCNVKTPPVSKCNAADGPSTTITPDSPAGSPQGLPANSDNNPSSSSTPVGSKTVPATSSGAIFKIPVQLIPLLAAHCFFLCFNLIPAISGTSMGYLQASAAF